MLPGLSPSTSCQKLGLRSILQHLLGPSEPSTAGTSEKPKCRKERGSLRVPSGSSFPGTRTSRGWLAGLFKVLSQHGQGCPAFMNNWAHIGACRAGRCSPSTGWAAGPATPSSGETGHKHLPSGLAPTSPHPHPKPPALTPSWAAF